MDTVILGASWKKNENPSMLTFLKIIELKDEEM